MSKHDFSAEEFAARRARVRRAIAEARLDWLLVFHPVSIHWLTGSDAKSYQEFQCLLISGASRAAARPHARGGAQRVPRRRPGRRGPDAGAAASPRTRSPRSRGWPTSLGLRRARVGMEVPAYYLHPHHYVRIKQLLGDALVAEPTNLVHDLKLVKSPTELAYIREASRIADAAMARLRRRRWPKAAASSRWRARSTTRCWRAGSGLRGEPDQPRLGRALVLQPRRAHGAAAAAGRFRQRRVRRGLPTLHGHDRPPVLPRRRRRRGCASCTTWSAAPATPASRRSAPACRRSCRTRPRSA